MMTTNKLTRFFASLLILLSSGCTLFSPAGEDTADWFGIQVPLADWEVVPMSDAVRLGMIQHRSLDGCQATIMTHDPMYMAGNPAGWEGTWKETITDSLKIEQVIVQDEANETQLIYYEVFDETNNPDFYRLAYYQVDWEEDATRCTEAFQLLLESIDPAAFPEIPTAQG